MIYTNKQVKIKATGSYVPERILTNEEIAKTVPTTSEWVYENLGIKERRISEKEEFTSDLASKAGLEVIKSAGIDRNDVDLIILATSTPDRKAPSTACIVQHKMGITNQCPAFDIAAVCSGFLYALVMGSQFIQTSMYKNVLIIGADTFSKITDWNRRDCVFFGDGAGAVLLQPSNYEKALFSSLLYSDGSGMNNFTVYPGDSYFSMNGKAVYDTGTKVLPGAIQSILEKNQLKNHDIAAVIPHQPSIRILKKTAEILEIPFEKVKTNMDRYANTSGATIPLLFDEVNRSGELKKDDLIVFAAVGSGWAWGASVYIYH